jgi:hypothetical protein
MSIFVTSADFLVVNHGTMTILHALSEDARAWVDEHLPDDVLTWGPTGTVIEPRDVAPILDGIASDGLTIQGDRHV